jgi:low affinity Fe/Cu permease
MGRGGVTNQAPQFSWASGLFVPASKLRFWEEHPANFIAWAFRSFFMTNKVKCRARNYEGEQDQNAPFIQARRQVANKNTISLWFSRFASRTAQLVGHPYMFLLAVAILIVWAISGPLFHFSDTWQLIINTGTTIVTFLVVFLIQNTQNLDAKALHLKLDELIRSHQPARNDMIDIETLSDEELDELEKAYASICERKKAKSRVAKS